jgi:hypothetical protein
MMEIDEVRNKREKRGKGGFPSSETEKGQQNLYMCSVPLDMPPGSAVDYYIMLMHAGKLERNLGLGSRPSRSRQGG